MSTNLKLFLEDFLYLNRSALGWQELELHAYCDDLACEISLTKRPGRVEIAGNLQSTY